jgi:hypothetical protein
MMKEFVCALGLLILTGSVVAQAPPSAARTGEPFEYQVISTLKVSSFEKRLHELAAQGFRLEYGIEASQVMRSSALLMRPQSVGTTPRYEYKVVSTRKVATLQKELEEVAQQGYEVRTITANAKVYLGTEITLSLERPVGVAQPRFAYQVLKTGMGKEKRFDTQLPQSLAAGFRPIKVLQIIDVGIGIFVGANNSANLILMERKTQDAAPQQAVSQLEYKVLETNRLSTMERELNQAAAVGFRLALPSAGRVALLCREPATPQVTYEYKLVDSDKKQKSEAAFNAHLQQGYVYRAIFGGGWGNRGIFERAKGETATPTWRECRLLRFPLKDGDEPEFQLNLRSALAEGFKIIELTGWTRPLVVLMR